MMTREQGWAGDLESLLRLNHQAGDTFVLRDAYALIPELQRLRPEAKNVEARVRDALQQLKHKGRVVFLAKKGTYRLSGPRSSPSSPLSVTRSVTR
jgi:hypothetical protein